MQVDPKVTFYIGLATCVALVCSTASVWAGWLPDAWVPVAVGVNSLVGKIGTAVMTFLSGIASSERGPIAKMLSPHE